MLIRIRFSKTGTLRFIGHLDVMRYFQKVLSRSGLPIKYSQGFHPHQLMSFAAPLGVGLTSDGEYMDFELEEELLLSKVEEALKRSVTDGFSISKVTELTPRVMNVKKVSSMALVDSADYFLYEKQATVLMQERFQASANKLLSGAPLIITKTTKTSQKELDIQPYIYSYAFDFASFVKNRTLEERYQSSLFCSIPEGIFDATAPKTGCKLFLHLSAGSVMNLKPETILQAILEDADSNADAAAFGIHRLELYHADEKGAWIPLWDIK